MPFDRVQGMTVVIKGPDGLIIQTSMCVCCFLVFPELPATKCPLKNKKDEQNPPKAPSEFEEATLSLRPKNLMLELVKCRLS